MLKVVAWLGTLLAGVAALRWLLLVFLREWTNKPLFEALFDRLQRVHHEKFQSTVPKRIILVRHGESQGNVDPKLYSTTPDRYIELSSKGKQQALKAGQELRALVKNETVLFLVSPFARCRQTYQQIAKAFGNEKQIKMREDPRIREQEWGNLQDSVQSEAMEKERTLVGKFFFRFPQGESGADVYDRVTTFLESLFRLFDRFNCEDNIVIVTHGLLMRLFLMRYFYWSVEKFESLENFRNCELVVLERLESRKSDKLGTYNLVTPMRYVADSHDKAAA